MMIDNLFTHNREFEEVCQGLCSKAAERKYLAADVEAYLAAGGKITKCETIPSEPEKRHAKAVKRVTMSEAELDSRLAELAARALQD